MLRSTDTEDRRRCTFTLPVRRGVDGRDEEAEGALLKPIRGDMEGDVDGVEMEPCIVGTGLSELVRRELGELGVSSMSVRLPSMKEVRRDRIMYLAPIPGGGLATLADDGEPNTS